jgi:hypothetical protein
MAAHPEVMLGDGAALTEGGTAESDKWKSGPTPGLFKSITFRRASSAMTSSAGELSRWGRVAKNKAVFRRDP